MGYLINQQEVLNFLHNQMGKRIPPGGTDDDLKRYIQAAFDYAWRYYRWPWALKTDDTEADGTLPTDFDLDGWYDLKDTYPVIWDSATSKLKLDGVSEATEVVYQMAPPTLGTDAAGSAPFPSVAAIAEGALIFAKLGENPTRADVQQEWDMFHSLLDRLAARSDNNVSHRPRNYHDVAGTYTGDVGV